MKKTKVLIVEDEFVLYDEIADFLFAKAFEVANYTKNYEEAITQIEQFKPDIVLLDINLESDKDGVDIGEILQNTYHIPFIYITDFGDEVTLSRALKTKPNHFVKKAKPNLDLNQLQIDIQLALKTKTGMVVLKDYLHDMKGMQTAKGGFLSKEFLPFDDIWYISRESYYKDEKDENNKNKTEIKTNYARVVTENNYSYFVAGSLKNIAVTLNIYFIRISDKNIVNLSPQYFDGLVGNNKILINGKEFIIGKTYKNELKIRLQLLYDL